MNEFRIFRALGLSFKAWFVNFIPFTLIAAVVYSPVIWWMVQLEPEAATSIEQFIKHSFEYPIYGLLALSTLLAPMLTYRVIQDLNGTKVSILTSVRFGVRGILPALFLAAITFAVQWIPAGGIVAAILTCIWFVAAPAAVGEQLGPFAAFSRSSELTRGRRWGIFGMTILLNIAVVILLLGWFIPTLQDGGFKTMAEIRNATVLILCVFAAYQMLVGIVEAVSYALLRQDKEGVSNAELARIFD